MNRRKMRENWSQCQKTGASAKKTGASAKKTGASAKKTGAGANVKAYGLADIFVFLRYVDIFILMT